MSPEEKEAWQAEEDRVNADLEAIGFSGEKHGGYRKRIGLIAVQRLHGHGPGGWLDRFLAQCARRNGGRRVRTR